MTELRTIITLRQGTTAQWADSQVILKVGEVGLEYCGDGLVKIKAGDGKSLWSGLSYVNKDVHDALIAEVNRASGVEVALGNRITALEEIDHEAYIAADTALKNELVAAINLKADKTALEGAVSTLNAAIALKADASALEAAVEALEAADATLAADVAKKANQTALESAVSDLEAAIALKAAAADVYTKAEIGTIAADKTLVQMIEEAQTAATYDDTEIRGLISAEAETARAAEKANADAIAAVVADYLKAADKTELEGKITAEATRADAAEKANAAEIARVDAALKLAVENNTEGMDSIKELATWIEEHGAEAAEMTAAIEANAAAIAAADRSIKTNSGKIDDNAAAIADNAEAIAANATQIKTDGENIVANTQAIAAEAQTARAAEAANAAAIKAVADDYLKAADKTELSEAIAAEAQTARAAEAANAAAIAAIYAVDGEAKSGVLVSEIARVEGLITDAIGTAADDASAKDAVVLASAQGYTDAAIAGLPAATAEALGLVKYDDATIKMNDSQQLYVAKVSTDVLEMGTKVLVLNGGSAAE